MGVTHNIPHTQLINILSAGEKWGEISGLNCPSPSELGLILGRFRNHSLTKYSLAPSNLTILTTRGFEKSIFCYSADFFHGA